MNHDELEEWVDKIYTKLMTLNDRTKIHTKDIKKLEKQMKEIKNE